MHLPQGTRRSSVHLARQICAVFSCITQRQILSVACKGRQALSSVACFSSHATFGGFSLAATGELCCTKFLSDCLTLCQQGQAPQSLQEFLSSFRQ